MKKAVGMYAVDSNDDIMEKVGQLTNQVAKLS